ncbi:MAG: D-alanyl-D-alanine carboxypeptidase/D-alanyl-D-alanine endopeptidase [Bdellovibrionota bacterium]
MGRYSLLFLLLSLIPARAGALTPEEFQNKLKAKVSELSGNVSASVRVEVLGKDRVLFSHNEDKKLVPASSTKLISTMAALEKMGPGFTFETKVIQKGEDLILAGNGDPYLVSERLWLLARAVARSGLKQVGSIYVNNSAFTEDYKGLMEFQNSGEPFTAMVSPTSLNFNSLEVHVTPSASGDKPKLELGPIPHGYAILKNEVKQVGGSGKDLSLRPVSVEGNQETFVVSGSIGKNSVSVIIYAAVAQPASYIAYAFAALLRSEGIKVGKDFGGAIFTPLSGSEKVLVSQEGPPLLDLVRLHNTFSNNFMTEQVFQAFGAAAANAPASLAKSKQAVNDFLHLRSSCRDASMENGSGLAWDTQISSHCFVETLQTSYRDFRVFADLLGSLPVGGQTGSLKSRFKKMGPDFQPWKVRAKTGTLWSKQAASSLVGFTQTATGETLVFSLIENDKRNDASLLRGMKDWEERCVELMQQLKL